MIVHGTSTHQMTIEFKLLQVPLPPSINNQSPYHNRNCKMPQNTKCETIHKTQKFIAKMEQHYQGELYA